MFLDIAFGCTATLIYSNGNKETRAMSSTYEAKSHYTGEVAFNWIPASVAANIFGEFQRVVCKEILLEVRVRKHVPLRVYARSLTLSMVSTSRFVVERGIRLINRLGYATEQKLLRFSSA